MRLLASLPPAPAPPRFLATPHPNGAHYVSLGTQGHPRTCTHRVTLLCHVGCVTPPFFAPIYHDTGARVFTNPHRAWQGMAHDLHKVWARMPARLPFHPSGPPPLSTLGMCGAQQTQLPAHQPDPFPLAPVTLGAKCSPRQTQHTQWPESKSRGSQLETRGTVMARQSSAWPPAAHQQVASAVHHFCSLTHHGGILLAYALAPTVHQSPKAGGQSPEGHWSPEGHCIPARRRHPVRV